MRACGRWRVVAALVCVVGWACSPPNDAGPVAELPLDPYVGRLVTLTTVVGNDTLPFLLDTGGGETLITPSVAGRIGCAPSGRSVGFRMSGERVEFDLCNDVTLSLAGHAFPHADIAVFDIASLLPADWPPLAGVIALKTFAGSPITLDLANAQLIIESEASLARRVGGMTRVRARVASGTDGRSLTVFLRMAAPTSGWYLLDSGNLDLVLAGSHGLSDSLAAVAGAEGSPGPVQLDGLAPIEVPWRAADLIYDGALSEAFMREWVFTLDLSNAETWVARAPPN